MPGYLEADAAWDSAIHNQRRAENAEQRIARAYDLLHPVVAAGQGLSVLRASVLLRVIEGKREGK